MTFIVAGETVPCPESATAHGDLWGSVKCRLRTIDFRVRKQWDYCCYILICMVKTIVCSLHFTLTERLTHSNVIVNDTIFIQPKSLLKDLNDPFHKNVAMRQLLVNSSVYS